MIKRLVIIIFVFLYWLLLANKLSIGYERIPYTGEILDERINLLAGISFLKTGIPTGWSNLSAYQLKKGLHKNFVLSFDGISLLKDNQKPHLDNIKSFDYPIILTKEVELVSDGKRQVDFVQPFFDHSPFGGIIYSLFVKGSQTIMSLDPVQYRFGPTFVVFWLNAVLLFVVVKLLTKQTFTGLIAFLIYTSVPTFILSSRLAMLENLLIPWTLMAMILLLVKRSRFTLILLGIVSGLAMATKESGLAVFIMSFIILLLNKTHKKLLLYFLLPSLILGGGIYLYFFALSPNLFLNVFGNQTGRGFFGPMNFISIALGPTFHNFPLDGWWLFGLISVFLLFRRKETYPVVTWGFLSTLVVYLFFAGLNYPWYSLPFIPFLVIAMAIFISDLFVNLRIPDLFLFFVFPLSSSFYWGFFVSHKPELGLLVYRLILGVFIIVSAMLFRIKQKIKYIKFLIAVFCIAIFLWNIKSVSFIIENWGKLPMNILAEQ